MLRRNLNTRWVLSPMMIPLDTLRAGEWADVTNVSGDAAWVGRLAELGIREGSRLCLIQPGSPCLLQLSGCKVCIRGGDASQILVSPVSGPAS